MSLRIIGALFALVSLFGSSAAMAASKPLEAGIVNEPSRFSAPYVYTGKPALAVTLSMIEAGGGPKNFSAVTLLKTLTGPLFKAELAKLTTEFGQKKVSTFVSGFGFVVSDALRIVGEKHIALPAHPSPNPANGRALAAALWGAGQTGRGFSVEVMLDRAVSHPIHAQIMRDVDKTYGLSTDATYHVVLNAAMHDLAAAYHLSN